MINLHVAAAICLIFGIGLALFAIIAMIVLFSRDPILGYGTTVELDNVIDAGVEEEAGEAENDEPADGDLDESPLAPAAVLPWRQPLHDMLARPVATTTTADTYIDEHLAPRIVDADDTRPGKHRHGEMRTLTLDQRARYLTHLSNINDATGPLFTHEEWQAVTRSIPVRQLDVRDDTEGALALFGGHGHQVRSHRADAR